jgi:hypothetical protein
VAILPASHSFAAQFTSMKNLLFALPFLVVACNSNRQETMVGGPCSYETTYHPAKVIDFNTSLMDALFEVNFHGKADTLGYHELNNAYLTPEQVVETVFSVGKTFKLAQDDIKTGTCTPVILRLQLEPFDSTATAK